MPDDLRDRLAAALKDKRWLACRDAEGDRYFRFASEHELADAVLAVVRPELDRLIAFLERGYEQHMRFGVLGDDGTVEMLRCADWCYRCKLERAGAERDAALASLARVERAAALADVPDGGDERAAGFNAAMAVVRIALAGPAEQPKRHHAGDFLRAPKTGETPTISCEFDASIEIPELGDQNAAEQVPCSFAVLARMHEGALMPHAPHSWQPQPGMTPVWCPGPAGAGSTQDGA